MVEVSVEGPHGPHSRFDPKTRIVTTKFAKMFFRVLPLHYLPIWWEEKESDLLLVCSIDVILTRHLLHGQG